MQNEVFLTAFGISFIFFMTCCGSAMVFFFRNDKEKKIQTIFLGLAAGIMISAAMFGLLMPAMEEAAKTSAIPWIPVAGGFALGVVFLLLLDVIVPHFHPETNETEGIHTSMKRTTLLVSAVTIHNIPEGMAVGLAFALAAQHADMAMYSAATALAIGIGIQNFPEGAAISLPLRHEGLSRKKSFIIGCLSGITEPIFALLMFFIAGFIEPVMPWLLAFSAGAMMFVVVEELIPEAHLEEHSNLGTIAVMIGFLIMMVLDISL